MPASQSPTDILRRYWGYDSFRPMQREIIDSVLAGHDTLGLLPTGGGKSITFQVPGLLLPGLTIVVTPLISLMKDQVDNLRASGIAAGCLYTGMSRSEVNLITDKCRLGKIKFLYIAPERLGTSVFTDKLRQWSVSLVVVDEAHCISQWGYDFRPSYLNIKSIRQIFPDVPILALTASATPAVAEDIIHQLEFRKGYNRYARSFDRSNLSYIVRYDDDKLGMLLRVLRNTEGTGIVYVRSRARSAELAKTLNDEGISADFYNAGIPAEDKTRKQDEWKRGETRIIVATNAFGMGIDKPDVRLVVHYDLPSSLEEYYQEAGRAGRDGLPAFAVLIASRFDKPLLARRLTLSYPPKDYMRRVYDLLCDYLNVPPGEGYGMTFSIDFEKFCDTYRLEQQATHSALMILSRAGYIDFVDDGELGSRVKIVASRNEFYYLDLAPVTDNVFNALLRNYTGLFADFVSIDESFLGRECNLGDDDVYQSFLELSRKNVLNYIPRKAGSFVYFPTSREESRHLLFPLTIYENRRKAMESRIQAMNSFVFGTDRCRAAIIREYFGETEVGDCGCCDICRDKHKLSASRAAKAFSSSDADIDDAILAAYRSDNDISLQKLLTQAAFRLGIDVMDITPDIIARIQERMRVLDEEYDFRSLRPED